MLRWVGMKNYINVQLATHYAIIMHQGTSQLTHNVFNIIGTFRSLRFAEEGPLTDGNIPVSVHDIY